MKKTIRGLGIIGIFLGLLLVVGPAQGAAPVAAANSDTAVTYGLNPAHDGYIANSALVPPLKRLWVRDLKGSISYPLVVGSLAYAVVGHAEGQGYGGWLYAFNVRTGATVWGPVEQGGVYWPASLAYDGGQVFALNLDGILRAYDAQTGQATWSTQLDQAVFNDVPLVAQDGIIYAPHDHGFTAVDETNGKVLWQGPNEGSPAVGDGVVYAGGCGSLAAYEPRSGAVRWQTQSAADCLGLDNVALVLHQGRLYATGGDGALYVFDAATGRQVQIYTGSTIPAFAGDRGFVLTSGTLQGFNATTGAILWSFAGDGHLTGSPLVVHNNVYIQSGDEYRSGHMVFVLDAATGREVFSTDILPPDIDGDPYIGHGGLRYGLGAGSGELLVPYGHWLVAFGPADSTLPPVAAPAPPPPVSAPPVVANGPDASVAVQINPAHTGSLLNDPLTPPLQQLWSRNLTDTVYNPLLVGDLAYVMAGGRLMALNAGTGALAWGPIPQGGTYAGAGLAYDNGRVFAVNFDGIVRAYDAPSGVPAWSTKLPGQWDFRNAPTAYKGMVYVGGAGSGTTLFALDETNGAVLWTAPAAGGSPAVDDTAVYSNSDCKMIALDVRTGHPLWQADEGCGGPFGDSSTVYAGRVYVPGDGGALYVYDAASGQQLQIYAASEGPAFAGSRGFLLAGGLLQAFDVANGAILWSFAGEDDLSGAPVVVHNTVYVGSKRGTLYGVDPESGQRVLSVADLGGEINGGLAAGNGELLVPAGSKLVAFTSGIGAPPQPPAPAPPLPPTPAPPGAPGVPAWAQPRFFPETGHTLQGRFRQYWEEHGGLAQQGYPLTDELSETSAFNGQSYTVQYFERAVFEMHPENPVPYDVLLTQLGTLRYQQRYPQGAPGQQRNPNSPRLFPETGYAVGGSFRPYWEAHGGLAQLGYPLSEEFPEKNDLDGQTYTVQYFERMVLEWHPANQPPYNILGSQLGRLAHDTRYPPPPSP